MSSDYLPISYELVDDNESVKNNYKNLFERREEVISLLEGERKQYVFLGVARGLEKFNRNFTCNVNIERSHLRPGEVACLLISLTGKEKKTRYDSYLVFGGIHRGNYYIGYKTEGGERTTITSRYSSNGEGLTNELAVAFGITYYGIDLRVNRHAILYFSTSHEDRMKEMHIHVMTGYLVRRDELISYRDLLLQKRQLPISISTTNVDNNVIDQKVLCIKPTNSSVIGTLSDLQSIFGIESFRESPLIAEPVVNAPIRANVSERALTKSEPVEEKMTSASDISRLEKSTDGVEALEDIAKLVSNYDDLIRYDDLGVILQSTRPLKVVINNFDPPQFMTKVDALSVNQKIRNYVQNKWGASDDEVMVNFMIIFIQSCLTYSTCWSPYSLKHAYVSGRLCQGEGLENVVLDVATFEIEVFSEFVTTYKNPLRKYMRYWSTTTINLIKNGIVKVNHVTNAKHGVLSKYSNYCFDFSVYDDRFDKSGVGVAQAKARQVAVRNSIRHDHSSEIVNTSQLLWR